VSPAVSIQTSTFLVPLLLVIVERLATMARGIAEDPRGLVDKPPVFTPNRGPVGANSPPDRWLRMPWVSRLNHLHLTNMALLAWAFIIVVASDPGLVRNVLALVVGIVWLQLPLLEVDEYDEIQANVSIPWALYLHVAGTVAMALLIVTSGGFTPGLYLSEVDFLSPDPGMVVDHGRHLVRLLVIVGVFLVTTFGFLRLFERQVRNVTQTATNDRDDEVEVDVDAVSESEAADADAGADD
jgi:hypothetical protein